MTTSPAQLPEPPGRVAPTAVVPDDLRDDIDRFAADGFFGPVKLYEPDEASELIREIRIKNQNQDNALYRNPVNYDRHFDIPELTRHISHPTLARYLAAILGPDVLLWRTEFFAKVPGAPATEWHQVRDYSYANGKAQLLPTDPNWNAFIDITVWTTFTPATVETGCLRFLRGSHKTWYFDERRVANRGRDDDYDVSQTDTAFFGYTFSDFKLDPDWTPPPADVVDLEMAPGEAVIFTANCVHGSLPNTTQRETRFAIAGRYAPTHVRIYPDQAGFTAHGASFDLSDYGSVLVSGHDRYDHNRIRTTSNLGEAFVTHSPDDLVKA